jgi:hypothetical protein
MRGQHLGYVPQDVELAGTVAENICSFEPEANDAAIIAAAHAASVHEMILRLPQGYETEIGESGSVLSAGQSQRLALRHSVDCPRCVIRRMSCSWRAMGALHSAMCRSACARCLRFWSVIAPCRATVVFCDLELGDF